MREEICIHTPESLHSNNPADLPDGPAAELLDGTYACIPWLQNVHHQAVREFHSLDISSVAKWGTIHAGQFREEPHRIISGADEEEVRTKLRTQGLENKMGKYLRLRTGEMHITILPGQHLDLLEHLNITTDEEFKSMIESYGLYVDQVFTKEGSLKM